ncbi:MAG TPA: Ig-like domain-containing protein [Saprospiraceae bacterium]|nr:Ig-like domain-containing protein [Saprospiraceae bacterium]HNT20589.1 Ig-like domain-containing protein [Saprospiraceae bacterium]
MTNVAAQSWNNKTICSPDFIVVPAGSGASLNVLANDVSMSGSPVYLKSISYSDQVSASIEGGNIRFTSVSNADGIGHLIYTACDAQGHCGVGEVSVLVVDPSRVAYSDTVYHAVAKSSSFRLYLPEKGFQLKVKPAHGLLAKIDDYQYEYHPLGSHGNRDLLVFESGKKRKVFDLTQVDRPVKNQFIQDDIVYLNKNTSRWFAALKNDLANPVITQFTQPDHGQVDLNPDQTFTFTSDFDFEGISRFEYTACNSSGCETASVYLYVSDFLPREDLSPAFRTAEGRSLVIPYQVPIEDYEFRIITPPQFGTLDFYSGPVSINLECEQMEVMHPLIYTPFPGFIGNDRFVVNFCLKTGTKQCAPVLIKVETYKEQTCRPATDFVWPGDANTDGLVDLKDLNTISALIGTEGQAREQGNTTWTNQYAPDWNRATTTGSINAKHADADGDGLVDAEDAKVIIQNYNQSNKIIPQGVYFLDPALSTSSPVAEVIAPGDDAVIQLAFGNQDNLLYDVEAISFDLEYNDELLGEEDILIEVLGNSWFGYDNSLLDAKVFTKGKISVNFASTRGKLKHGAGKTIKVRAKGGPIVSHVEGFKIPKKLPVEFKVTNIQLTQGNGTVISLPGSRSTVTVDFDRKPQDKAEFALYPNPATNWVGIKTLDPDERLEKIMLIGIDGKTILNRKLDPVNQINQSLYHLEPGLYILQAHTSAGVFSKKLEILR